MKKLEFINYNKNKLCGLELSKELKRKNIELESFFYYTAEISSFKEDGEIKAFNYNTNDEDFRPLSRSSNSKQPHIIISPKLNDVKDFFREEYDIHIEIISHKYQSKPLKGMQRTFRFKINERYFDTRYQNYEECFNEAILESCKMI